MDGVEGDPRRDRVAHSVQHNVESRMMDAAGLGLRSHFAIPSVRRCAAVLLALAALAAPGSVHAERPASPVSITFTAHGVPHVNAADFYDLGYGFAYAAARIDVCAIAEVFVDVAGHRAADFGGSENQVNPLVGRPSSNVVGDLATDLLVDSKVMASQRAGLTPDGRDLVAGYADGFNRYLADTPRDKLPKACRAAAWVRPISSDDVLHRVANAMLLTGVFDQELFDARPPAERADAARVKPPVQTAMIQASDAGSNGYAFGGSHTQNGRGLLVGNPHWFWGVPNRFMQVQLTVPGKYDVMGVAVIGMPLITIGYNRSLAWTHTVATDARGTVFELKLDPADPTRYLVDGRSVAMRQRTMTIDARGPDGAIHPVSHIFWLTELGPVVQSKQLPWDRSVAYALADVNATNNRYLRQLVEIGSSPDVRTLKQRMAATEGLVWVNTLAVDSTGEALFADLSSIPDVPKAEYADCARPVTIPQAAFVNIMDGSRAACRWRSDPLAAAPGVMPARDKPWAISRDYFENSNASYWLVNPKRPLEGFSPMIGQERTAPNIRTRQGHLQAEAFFASGLGSGATVPDQTRIEGLLFSNRDLLADLVLDDLIAACRRTPQVNLPDGRVRDLTRPCEILAAWDRKDELSSVGAPIFREFARQEKPPGEEDPVTAKGFWRTPFDPANPIATPAGLDTSTTAPLQALARGVEKLEKAGVALDARLGDIQFIERNGRRIPLHGGLIFNRISLTLKPGGYTEPIGSADSYIQVVGFDANGPVADTLLVNSQSSDPDSPWYADQAPLYAQKLWVRPPFTPEAIAAEAIEPPLLLTTHRAR